MRRGTRPSSSGSSGRRSRRGRSRSPSRSRPRSRSRSNEVGGAMGRTSRGSAGLAPRTRASKRASVRVGFSVLLIRFASAHARSSSHSSFWVSSSKRRSSAVVGSISAVGIGSMRQRTPARLSSYETRPSAPGVTRTELVPLRPARPVRPLRCVYASASVGGSAWMTRAMSCTSMPRAATSVATSACERAALERRERPVALALLHLARERAHARSPRARARARAARRRRACARR